MSEFFKLPGCRGEFWQMRATRTEFDATRRRAPLPCNKFQGTMEPLAAFFQRVGLERGQQGQEGNEKNKKKNKKKKKQKKKKQKKKNKQQQTQQQQKQQQVEEAAATKAAVKPGGGPIPLGKKLNILFKKKQNPPNILFFGNVVDTEAGDAVATETGSSSSSSKSKCDSSSKQAKEVAATNAAVKSGGGSYPSGSDFNNFFKKQTISPPIVPYRNKVDTEAGVEATAKASSSSGSSSNGKGSGNKKNQKQRQRKKEKLARARATTEVAIMAAEAAAGAPFCKLLATFMSVADANQVWQAAAGKVCVAYEELQPFSETLLGRLGQVRATLLKFLPAGTVEKLLVPQLWGPKWLMLEVVHFLLRDAAAVERESRLIEVDTLWHCWNSGIAGMSAVPSLVHAVKSQPHDYDEVHAELVSLISEPAATQLMANWYCLANMLSEAEILLGNNEDVLDTLEDIWLSHCDLDDNYVAHYGAEEQGGWGSCGDDSDDLGGLLDGFDPFG